MFFFIHLNGIDTSGGLKKDDYPKGDGLKVKVVRETCRFKMTRKFQKLKGYSGGGPSETTTDDGTRGWS